MKKSHTLMIAGLAAAGVLTGFAARRISSNGAAPVFSWDAGADGNLSQRNSGSVAGTGSNAKAVLPEIPVVRSTETLDEILTADPVGNYARIARWLATAGGQDLAAYWERYKGGKRNVAVMDLIFLNWTRRNPQAAVAAVAGTEDERYAWWAWSASDPVAALAAARGGDRERMAQVANGIGQFNPAWLQAHLNQIPEEFRGDALERMKNWTAGQDPLAALKFMMENGMSFDSGIFEKLVQKDPWAAFDWWKENPDASNPFDLAEGPLQILASTMARENPEALEGLAARTPAGESRRVMEQALFDHLLETDPEAALKQARSGEVPLIAAQQLGKIALGMIPTDPDRAFQIAGEILAANQGTLEVQTRIEYEGGGISSGEPGKARELMDALFVKDRERTLKAMAAELAGKDNTHETFSQYASQWADDDVKGFMTWTDQQSGIVRQVSCQQIGYKLAGQGDYSEAIEWIASAPDTGNYPYSFVLSRWQGADPAAAAAWVENSGLTEEQKAHYRDFLKRVGK